MNESECEIQPRLPSPPLFIAVSGKSEAERASAIEDLSMNLEKPNPISVPIAQGWIVLLLNKILGSIDISSAKIDKVKTKTLKWKTGVAIQAVNDLLTAGATHVVEADSDLICQEPFSTALRDQSNKKRPKFDSVKSSRATLNGIIALTRLVEDDISLQNSIVDYGVPYLLRHFLLHDNYKNVGEGEMKSAFLTVAGESSLAVANPHSFRNYQFRYGPHIRMEAARLLTIISRLEKVKAAVVSDGELCDWLERCSNGITDCSDLKLRSYARATLWNAFEAADYHFHLRPHFGVGIFLINPELPHWNTSAMGRAKGSLEMAESSSRIKNHSAAAPLLDIVFVHGLQGGPFNTWRLADQKFSTNLRKVARTCSKPKKTIIFWPSYLLSSDFPEARMFTVQYKTKLTAWCGTSQPTFPLQDISSVLLEKLVSAGIGDCRPEEE